eukprot:31536-Rhodomonas_salina.1
MPADSETGYFDSARMIVIQCSSELSLSLGDLACIDSDSDVGNHDDDPMICGSGRMLVIVTMITGMIMIRHGQCWSPGPGPARGSLAGPGRARRRGPVT